MIFLVFDEIFIHGKSNFEIFLCVLSPAGIMFSVDIAETEESIPNTNLLLLTVNTNSQSRNNASRSILQHSLPSHVISLRLILENVNSPSLVYSLQSLLDVEDERRVM